MAGELLIFVALALLFAPLEHLRPIRAGGAQWRRWPVDFCHFLVTGRAVAWTVGPAMAGLSVLARPYLPAGLGAAVRAQPALLQFVEILVLSDFGFYWAHRLMHAVPFLWKLHEVHHSSERLDWIAGFRVHPLDQSLNSTIIAASTVLFGFSPGALLAYALVYRAHAMLLHSNLNVGLGPLRRIIASPQYHHWHHADHPEAWNKNFGGQLVVFDWLFGTQNLPEPGRWPQKYGLAEPLPADYLGQLLHPFGVRLAPARAPVSPPAD